MYLRALNKNKGHVPLVFVGPPFSIADTSAFTRKVFWKKRPKVKTKSVISIGVPRVWYLHIHANTE